MLTDDITASGAAVTLSSSERSDALGRDDFLKMLVAQLENQDPLNPQDSTEFTAQLAQFSSLEQLIAMRESIEAMTGSQASGQATTQALTAAGLIGREVLVESDAFELVSGVPPLAVELESAADGATFTVRNASGVPVFETELGALRAGRTEIAWDGLDERGNALDPGVYRLEVLASSDVNPVPTTTLVRTRVTGAAFTDDEPQIQLGAVSVGLSGVREVREAEGAR